MTARGLQRYRFWGHVAVFSVALVVLLVTMRPGIWTTDSPELVAAAVELGIPHAPGYPLYVLIAHLFTKLPVDDPAWAVNFLSVVSLAGVTPFLYDFLHHLWQDRRLAAAVSLAFVWLLHVWSIGIVAEVYAPGVFLLTITAWLLMRCWDNPTWQNSVAVGAAYGLAVAMLPSLALMSAGIVCAVLLMPIQWGQRIVSGLVALGIFCLCFLLIPFFDSQDPALNSAGWYRANGQYETVNLQEIGGVWWLLSGQQFEALRFADGILPTPDRTWSLLRDVTLNTLGLGVLWIAVGIGVLWREARRWLWVGMAMGLPYTYFFMQYGATDRDTMFAPTYLLLMIPLGVGIRWTVGGRSNWQQRLLIALLPSTLLVVGLVIIGSEDDHRLIHHTEIITDNLPEDAHVFGDWRDTMPIRYQQIVAGEHPDMTVYTLFFFRRNYDRMRAVVDRLLMEERMVYFVAPPTDPILREGCYATRVILDMPNSPDDRRLTLTRILTKTC